MAKGKKTKAATLPPALKKGDLIGIMAPSGRVKRETIDKAERFLKKQGYEVFVHPQTYNVAGQSAGTAAEKLKAFHDLWRNKDIKAIFAARGGNRAGYMLDGIDYKLIKKNPKILMGFSDVTALLSAVTGKSGLVTFHGPLPHNFAGAADDEYLRQCFNLLSGKASASALPLKGGKVLRKGRASGRLVGGNLSLICSLIGTPYLPDLDGAILFVEDCSDEFSRFDRMFLQLRNAGVFDKIAGLVVGQFTDVQDTGSVKFGFSLEDIIAESTKGKKIPVVINAPFGHGRQIATYPVGAAARLDASGGRPSLRLTGPGRAVS